MTRPKRKLIEVALPLEAINRESAREKSIRHGHPSTLHLWWARRPLAACRAVLFAQLVDDPSSNPEQFPTDADQARERRRLFDLIERLVIWENSNDEALLAEATVEILNSCGGDLPVILDPFAGGGSIPLEAQRLGLRAEASDLNPVAVLINRALIEYPPKWSSMPPVYPEAASQVMGDWAHSTGLAEDVRRYGRWMRDEAERRVGHMYPPVTLPDGSKAPAIAWIWARTVICPNPACAIEMPLTRTWWLSKKKGHEAFVVPTLVGDVNHREVKFSVRQGLAGGPSRESDGTVGRAGAVCVACDTAVPLEYVRAQGKSGHIGSRLMAIVAGGRGRTYVAPTAEHEAAARVPMPEGAPDTDLPLAALGFRVQGYGMARHADLFTARQLNALSALCDLVLEVRAKIYVDSVRAGLREGDSPADGLEQGGSGAGAYADSVAAYLGLAFSRTADLNNSLVTWSSGRDQARNLFSMQAVSMAWDFVEVFPFGDAAGDLGVSVSSAARVLERFVSATPGVCVQADAATRSYRGVVVSTDPPYYDNVGYADLSDFFYVWLRRALGSILPNTLTTMLTPKADELVADPFRHGGPLEAEQFFEDGFTRVFAHIRKECPPDFPTTVFYAFKQAESDDDGTASTGWQTLLEGMLRSGWEVTATWPVRTERVGRSRDIGSNALASSIVLACRPRTAAAEAIGRRAFLTTLKSELPQALRELQQSSIAPVDLAQAAIGPGMAVFSRHSRVVEADGSDMSVRTALALINLALDEVLSEQEGDFDADTRFCVKWFSQFGWNEASSGEADILARATNTSVDGLSRGGVFRAVAGRASLKSPDELSEGWDPAKDDRISDWEVVLRLARALDDKGSVEAARLMAASGSRVDLETAKELAYLLFAISEKQGWSQTALLFNSLGTSWSDLTAATLRGTDEVETPQGAFDFGDNG